MSGSARSVCAITAVALLLGATSYANAASVPRLSDRDAAGLIESWFAGSGWTARVRTGQVLVARDAQACAGSDAGRKGVSEAEYKTMLAWAAVGLIKLSVTSIAGRPLAFTQTTGTACAPRAMKRILVVPTQAGLALDERTPVTGIRDAHFLYARTYAAAVTEIVDNSELRQNGDIYRIVKCVVRFHYTNTGRVLTRLTYGGVPEHQKQIVLLKYDPFEKRWTLVTSDATAIGSEFRTEKVADFLVQHGSL